MGWLWSSQQNQHKSSNTFPPHNPPISTPPTSSHPPVNHDATVEPPPLTRDQAAEAELQAFISEIQSESSSSSDQLFANSPFSSTNIFSAPAKSSNPTKPPSNSAPSLTSDLDSTLIGLSHVHPNTISCRAAFDTAFYCQSLGGQFNSVYRYGTLRNCSSLWSQFWFCVKTNRRRMNDEERQKRVIEHYRDRETKYRVGPSSEDVWVSRERMISGAFEGDLEAVEREERARDMEI